MTSTLYVYTGIISVAIWFIWFLVINKADLTIILKSILPKADIEGMHDIVVLSIIAYMAVPFCLLSGWSIVIPIWAIVALYKKRYKI